MTSGAPPLLVSADALSTGRIVAIAEPQSSKARSSFEGPRVARLLQTPVAIAAVSVPCLAVGLLADKLLTKSEPLRRVAIETQTTTREYPILQECPIGGSRREVDPLKHSFLGRRSLPGLTQYTNIACSKGHPSLRIDQIDKPQVGIRCTLIHHNTTRWAMSADYIREGVSRFRLDQLDAHHSISRAEIDFHLGKPTTLYAASTPADHREGRIFPFESLTKCLQHLVASGHSGSDTTPARRIALRLKDIVEHQIVSATTGCQHRE